MQEEHTWHGTELWTQVCSHYSGPLKDDPIMAAQYGKGPFVVAHNDKPVYRGPFLDPLTDGLLTA
jgi:hypothetical protein